MSAREAAADAREEEADRRERAADERERSSDVRERMLDRWERDVAARAADVHMVDPLDEAERDQARVRRERERALRREEAEARREAAIERELERVDRPAPEGRRPRDDGGDDGPATLARLVVGVRGDPPLEEVIDLILSAAVDTVPGCEACSIALTVTGRLRNAAATAPWAAELDAAQLEAGCGPVVTASAGATVVTHELAADERWPGLGRLPRDAGARGAMSFGLVAAGEPAGVLTMYGAAGFSFTDEALRMGDVLAAHATLTLGRTIERLTFEARAEAWQRALASRDTIGQAKGILMQQRSVSAEEAFVLLRETSQLLNLKVRDVAQYVVDERRLPTAQVQQSDDR